jgi:hypothetical protein
MKMPKRPVSVTIEEANLLWLRGRARALKRRSLSDALDEIVTAARTRGRDTVSVTSVVGTVDIAAADPSLDRAEAYVGAIFEKSVARPMARDVRASSTRRRRRRA